MVVISYTDEGISIFWIICLKETNNNSNDISD